MNAPAAADEQKPALFRCTSTENKWPHSGARYDGVSVNWFVRTRPEGYADQFGALCNQNDLRSRSVIEEAFTADEALAFAAYLKARHNIDVKIEPQQLPVPSDIVAVGGGAISDIQDFYMLSKEDGYTLPFPVHGFYNVKDAKLVERLSLKHRPIVIKLNDTTVKTPCAVCERADLNAPYAAFSEGTRERVCTSCLDKHIGGTGSWDALYVLNGAMVLAFHGKGKELAPVIAAMDSALGFSQAGRLEGPHEPVGAGLNESQLVSLFLKLTDAQKVAIATLICATSGWSPDGAGGILNDRQIATATAVRLALACAESESVAASDSPL